MKIFLALTTLVLFGTCIQAADGLYGTLSGWGQMVDPDGNSRFEAGHDGVTVTFGRGRKGLDAEGGPGKMNSPRVLSTVDGDFSVSTIVKGDLPLPERPYAYISGGLVLILDQQSYIRLERANFIRNGAESFYTNFEQRIDAKRTRMGRFADFPLQRDQDVELRLEVEGKTVRGLVRHVGEDWHEMGTAKIDRDQLLQVGISGVKTIEDEVRVSFTKFRIHRSQQVDAADSSEIDLSEPSQRTLSPMAMSAEMRELIPAISELQTRSIGIDKMTDAELEQLITDTKDIAGKQVVGIPPAFGASIANALAERFKKTGKDDLAIRIYREVADVIIKKDESDKSVQVAAERLRKQADRLETHLQLIGKPIELSGKLLSGGAIDGSQFEGKVVLVDFWASWCGPCLRDMPNIKQQYETYRERGFEIVGVCLDRNREKAEACVKSKEIPWPSIFDSEAEDESMAERYAITKIPTGILVDRSGKIVSLQAHGNTLKQLLENLLDSDEETKSAPKGSSKNEK